MNVLILQSRIATAHLFQNNVFDNHHIFRTFFPHQKTVKIQKILNQTKVEYSQKDLNNQIVADKQNRTSNFLTFKKNRVECLVASEFALSIDIKKYPIRFFKDELKTRRKNSEH